MISLSSNDFDTYLDAIRNDGTRLMNDDYMGSDSRLLVWLNRGQTITITPSAFGDGTGFFQLVVGVLPKGMTLQAGKAINGTIQSGEMVIYEYTGGKAGDTINIRMVSNDFDTYLEAVGPLGLNISNDDSIGDGEFEYYSELQYHFMEDEDITITARGYSIDSEGSYTIEIQAWDGPAIKAYAADTAVTSGDSFAAFMQGEPHDYRIMLSAGQTVTITMESTVLDSYLDVNGPNGQQWSDDDSAGGLDSQLQLTAMQDGWFTIQASSLGNDTGIYTLSISE